MSGRRFFLLPEKAEGAIAAYRNKWAGKWPRDLVGWSELDNDSQMVLDEVFTPAERKRIATDPNYRNEYRDFIGALKEGEPAERVVDPIMVAGNRAASQATDYHGYMSDLAARDGGGEK